MAGFSCHAAILCSGFPVLGAFLGVDKCAAHKCGERKTGSEGSAELWCVVRRFFLEFFLFFFSGF